MARKSPGGKGSRAEDVTPGRRRAKASDFFCGRTKALEGDREDARGAESLREDAREGCARELIGGYQT